MLYKMSNKSRTTVILGWRQVSLLDHTRAVIKLLTHPCLIKHGSDLNIRSQQHNLPSHRTTHTNNLTHTHTQNSSSKRILTGAHLSDHPCHMDWHGVTVSLPWSHPLHHRTRTLNRPLSPDIKLRRVYLPTPSPSFQRPSPLSSQSWSRCSSEWCEKMTIWSGSLQGQSVRSMLIH